MIRNRQVGVTTTLGNNRFFKTSKQDLNLQKQYSQGTHNVVLLIKELVAKFENANI